MLFLDVAIAAHLLSVVFCFVLLPVLVHLHPSLCVQMLQIMFFKEKRSSSAGLNKGFTVSATISSSPFLSSQRFLLVLLVGC